MKNDVAIFFATGEMFNDPQVVQTESSNSFTICLMKIVKSKYNEETKKYDEGEAYDVIKFKCFGYLANYANKYLKQGNKLTIAGKPSGNMSYSEKYGESNFTDLIANRIMPHTAPVAAQPSQDEVAADQHYEADMAAKQAAQPTQQAMAAQPATPPPAQPAQPAQPPASPAPVAPEDEWVEPEPIDPDDIPM